MKVFISFQWQKDLKPSVKYLAYRWTVAAYFTFVMMFSLVVTYESNHLKFYMIYLTNWSVILNVIASIFHAAVVTLYHRSKSSIGVNRKSLSNLLKAHWLLSALSSVCVGMSIIYWLIIYTEKEKSFSGFMTHAGNAVMMVVDLFIRGNEPRFGHLIYPMCVGFVYGFVFTVPFIYLGGTNKDSKNFIYPSVDWKGKPIEAFMFSMASFVFVGLTHLFLTVLETTRVYLYQRIMSKKTRKQCLEPVTGGKNLLNDV